MEWKLSKYVGDMIFPVASGNNGSGSVFGPLSIFNSKLFIECIYWIQLPLLFYKVGKDEQEEEYKYITYYMAS